jgi:hypothetical protein
MIAQSARHRGWQHGDLAWPNLFTPDAVSTEVVLGFFVQRDWSSADVDINGKPSQCICSMIVTVVVNTEVARTKLN